MKNKGLMFLASATVLIVLFAVVIHRWAVSDVSTIETLKENPRQVEAEDQKTSGLSKLSNETSDEKISKDQVLSRNQQTENVEEKQWLVHAAARLDQATGVQSLEIERELKDKAKIASPEELKLWQMTAQNSLAAQNERILATYLLSLAESKPSDLSAIAEQELPDKAEHPVHSPEQQKQMQEKALRTMAIDALYDRATKDPTARAELERLSKVLQDHGLRSYAERKFRQLK